MAAPESTIVVEAMLNKGTDEAWAELLELARERFCHLARMIKGKQNLPEETDDLVQKVGLRLFQTPPEVRPKTKREYYGFVALQIRRELIDLVRKARRIPTPLGQAGTDTPAPQDVIANSTFDPARLAQWGEFHVKVASLPDEEREVFEMLWYHEINQAEAAEILGISLATLKRRWLSARQRLHEFLGGDLPF